MKILILLLSLLFIASCAQAIGPVGSTHQHAIFKVFIEGNQINFSQDKYMVRSQYVHIESGDGETIHKHATGITIGYFFKTINFDFDKKCFKTDSGENLCNDNENTLKFYINGIKSEEYGNHEIKDGEKYLITYGNESEEEIQKQLESFA